MVGVGWASYPLASRCGGVAVAVGWRLRIAPPLYGILYLATLGVPGHKTLIANTLRYNISIIALAAAIQLALPDRVMSRVDHCP